MPMPSPWLIFRILILKDHQRGAMKPWLWFSSRFQLQMWQGRTLGPCTDAGRPYRGGAVWSGPAARRATRRGLKLPPLCFSKWQGANVMTVMIHFWTSKKNSMDLLYPGMDDIFMMFLLLWCFTGGLGDCWLMSALSCLGQYPQKLILGDNVKNTRSGVNRGYNV